MALTEISDYLVYTIEECMIFFKDRNQRVNREEVLEFSVGCDFGGDFFYPEFNIAIKVDRNTFFSLMAEKDSLTMNLKIGYSVFTPQTGEEGDKGKTRIWFNEKFVVRMDAKQYDILLDRKQTIQEEYRAGEEKNQDVSVNKEYIIDLYLFKERDLNAGYSVINKVYTNTDLNTVVTHQLSQAGASSVLMSPLENRTLSEILTMPYTLIYNLVYLSSQYGLHSHGTLIFFDLDTTYILNKKPGRTAWREGEYTEIIMVIRDDDDTRSFMAGSRLNPDDSKVYINVDPSGIEVNSFSTIDDLIRGGEIIGVDTGRNIVSSVKSPGIKKHHPRYLHNKYSNSIAMKEVEQSMRDRDLIVSVSIQDGNIHWFRPNKDFRFNFLKPELNKILGGRYKLTNTFMKFTNHGDHFRNQTSLIYSKEV